MIKINYAIKRTLVDARLINKKIDRVIFIGGSTQISVDIGGFTSAQYISKESVAKGASYHAALLHGMKLKRVLLLDATTHSLNVETDNGVFKKIIGRNLTIPTANNHIFSTAVDNQVGFGLNVYQGDGKGSLFLGRLQLEGILPAKRGIPKIDVRFDIDASSNITVSAKELGTGKEQYLSIATDNLNENVSSIRRQDLIQAELERRLAIWDCLSEIGGPNEVHPKLIKKLRIHLGQQSVYREQKLTSALTPTGTGVAVSLLHTGSNYADDLFEDGLIFHYPDTNRGKRDTNEIASIKACFEYKLPIFIVIKPAPNSPVRNVRLGWVTNIDDDSRQLLILFSSTSKETQQPLEDVDDMPFDLKGRRLGRVTTTISRPDQAQFRFNVIKRYGAHCAFCGITELGLLEAAHICPAEEDGTDDPRNGLVLCMTHHKAFDLGYILINPDDLSLHSGYKKIVPASIGIKFNSIEHLKKKPHYEALKWVWSKWSQVGFHIP